MAKPKPLKPAGKVRKPKPLPKTSPKKVKSKPFRTQDQAGPYEMGR